MAGHIYRYTSRSGGRYWAGFVTGDAEHQDEYFGLSTCKTRKELLSRVKKIADRLKWDCRRLVRQPDVDLRDRVPL